MFQGASASVEIGWVQGCGGSASEAALRENEKPLPVGEVASQDGERFFADYEILLPLRFACHSVARVVCVAHNQGRIPEWVAPGLLRRVGFMCGVSWRTIRWWKSTTASAFRISRGAPNLSSSCDLLFPGTERSMATRPDSCHAPFDSVPDRGTPSSPGTPASPASVHTPTVARPAPVPPSNVTRGRNEARSPARRKSGEKRS